MPSVTAATATQRGCGAAVSSVRRSLPLIVFSTKSKSSLPCNSTRRARCRYGISRLLAWQQMSCWSPIVARFGFPTRLRRCIHCGVRSGDAVTEDGKWFSIKRRRLARQIKNDSLAAERRRCRILIQAGGSREPDLPEQGIKLLLAVAPLSCELEQATEDPAGTSVACYMLLLLAGENDASPTHERGSAADSSLAIRAAMQAAQTVYF
jgi:hypothetical protein